MQQITHKRCLRRVFVAAKQMNYHVRGANAVSFVVVKHVLQNFVVAVLLTHNFYIKTILLTTNLIVKKSFAFATIYLLASIMYCDLFWWPVCAKITRCIFWTPEYNKTFFAHRPISLYHK